MVQVKLAKAIEKPGVLFRIGERSVTITQQPSPVDDADYETIRTQFPGWIQRVSAKAPSEAQEG
ncbi:hypothetical protein GCM10028803_53410 [Larkinella knui]|uniref:Uncharacterized protein n=1 Tax=Larkinella knui TaxID=2025310 RepID=A0A3P1CGJ4_9BACT|nr:hypothetical protein [Larkinella knui]RRB12452.1 hypothetical protein EHT87_19835 [Larkinella knui]